LKRQALEIRVKLLRNLNRTIESEVRLEGMAQSKLTESRQERALQMQRAESSHETRNDDDESGSRGDQSLMTE
jgi:hypothetical protein